MKKILIIAAHPDDELLGCGGAMIKYKELGASFKVLFLGEGSTCRFEDINSKEAVNAIAERNSWAKEALSFVGIENYEFHNLPCGRFDQVAIIDINKIIENAINHFKPDTLLTHSDVDANNDHRITHRSTIMASRPYGASSVKRVMCYEVLSSSEWGFKEAFQPNYFIEISEEELKMKWQALECYKTEMRPYPYPRSWEAVKMQAMRRGTQAGVEFAEAFQLIRELKQ